MKTVELRGARAPRSPRIFQKRIRRAEAGIRAGEIVRVVDGTGECVGRGFYSPRSVIAVRVLERGETGPAIDGRWFDRKIGTAVALRRDVLQLDRVADAYRVVHAEGDGLSGLVVDRYAQTAVVEVRCRGMFEALHEIEAALKRHLQVHRIVVRSDPKVEEVEGFRAREAWPDPVLETVTEHELRYEVDCRGGHKTGFFVDQREARLRLRELAQGRTVLDLCCYTGGFALSAAAGGAAEVLGCDLDETAVAQARRHAELNGLSAGFEHADAFDLMRSGARAQVVVLDPPKLAATPRQLPMARRKSVDFNRAALRAVDPGGLLLTFSCTGLVSGVEFEGHLREAASRAGRSAQILERLEQPPDHPVHVACPEGRYLHGLLVRVA